MTWQAPHSRAPPQAGEGEAVRKKQLHDADPVNALQLGAVLREKVQVCWKTRPNP